MSKTWQVQIVFKNKAMHVVVLVLTCVQGEHEHPTPFCEVTALTTMFDGQNHFHCPHMCNLKMESTFFTTTAFNQVKMVSKIEFVMCQHQHLIKRFQRIFSNNCLNYTSPCILRTIF